MSAEAVIDQLNEALETLYGNSTPEIKDKANEFLMNFQRSQDSWQVIFPVLGNESYSLQLKIFISQTLRSKVQYDFSQLPRDSLISLKDSLIQLIILYDSKKQKLITTQLCISLANFTLQFLDWKNSINEIVSILTPNSINSLLEFLKILPEELLDVKKTPLTDEEFEIRLNELISSNIEEVLYILTSLTDSNSTNKSFELDSLILSCIKSWIIDIPIEKILFNKSLYLLIFNGLLHDETFETSIDCLSTIISETIEYENLEIIKELYTQLINLKELIIKNQDDYEKMERFAELFSTAGESWAVLIAKNPIEFKPLVEIILQLTSYDEDLDIVKYTFKFWYDLKNLLISNSRIESKKVYQPIYSELVRIINKHLSYPTISDSTNLSDLFENDKESEDKFKEFRYEMGDVLKDCCAVIGSSNALNISFETLKNTMNLQQKGEKIKWQEIESSLFSIRAMAKEVGTNEEVILPQIMKYLIELPENPKIRYAATLVLGRYTEWTAKHPEYLEFQLNYIINGFQHSNTEIIIAASHALKYFCMDCSKLLTNYLEELFNFYSNISDSLDIDSLYDITEGIAHILNEESDFEKLYNITLMFWKPTLEKLNQLNELTPGNVDELNEIHVKIADNIEIITIYVNSLKPKSLKDLENPISKILIDIIWPLLFKIIDKNGKSIIVSERCLKLIRRSIQNFRGYLLPILSSTAEMLVLGFKNYKFGCYLWVSGSFIKEYSYDEEDQTEGQGAQNKEIQLIKESIWSFAVEQINTFMILFTELEPHLINYPDLIEDFFRMMNDILMFSPSKLIDSNEIIESVYQVSIKSLDIFHECETITAVLQFLIDFYSWGFESPPISFVANISNELKLKLLNFIVNTGEQLLSKLMYGLIYSFPSDCWTDSNELLIKLIKLSTLEDTSKISLTWIDKFLMSLPQGSVNEKERMKLLNTIQVAISSKDYRRVRSSFKDFINWYRRKNVDRGV